MSNLSDRSKVNSAHLEANSSQSPANFSGRGNGVKGFFLGMLFTVLLGLVGGGAYWFAQRQTMASQSGNQSANQSANQSGNSTASVGSAPVDSGAIGSAPASSAPASSTAMSAAGSAPGDRSTANPLTAPVPPAGETFKDLNLQVNHANGSTLRVTGIAVGESTITVRMAITNGYKEAIKLQDDNDATILKDDAGNVYNLAAPPENPTISINPNSTVRGNFVFIGQLAPSATTLTLTTNAKYGGDATYSKDPKFLVGNIPVE